MKNHTVTMGDWLRAGAFLIIVFLLWWHLEILERRQRFQLQAFGDGGIALLDTDSGDIATYYPGMSGVESFKHEAKR